MGCFYSQATEKRSSRKLNLYHYSFFKPLYIGVFLYAADRPVHDELPPYGVLGNRTCAVLELLLYPSSSYFLPSQGIRAIGRFTEWRSKNAHKNAARVSSGSSSGESIPQLVTTSPPTATRSASPPPSLSSKPLAPIPGLRRSSSSPPVPSWPSPSSQPR